MEIKKREIIYNVDFVERLRTALSFLIKIPLPLLGILIIAQYAFLGLLNALKTNPLILAIPLGIIIGSAVLLTPFIFYVLTKEKRRAWMIFLIAVVFPYLLTLLIAFDEIFSSTQMIILFLPFYIYCYLLKHTTDEWLREQQAHELRREQKKAKAEQLEQEEGWY